MPAFGYLYLRGLPFYQPHSMLPSTGQITRADAQAMSMSMVRRGLIWDLNDASATAGVLLDSPVSQARQVCPDLISVPFVESVYEERMRPFMAVLRHETGRFEFDSPNSLFIDFAGSGEPVGVLQRLLAAGAGFELVAGLAPTKFVARAAVLAAMAAQTYRRHPMYLPKPRPPQRCLSLPGRSVPVLRLVDLMSGGASRDFLATLPVGYLWAASEERRERLHRLGLQTCGDLAAMDRRELCRALGSDAGRLVDLAKGVDNQGVSPSYTPEEIVRRLDFEEPISGKLALKRSLGILGEDLGRALTDEGLGCRAVALTLHWSNGQSTTLGRSFNRPRGEPAALAMVILSLLDQAAPEDEVLGIEIAARGIERAAGEQISFLARAVGQPQQDNLLQTLSFLERRFPGGTVRLGPPPPSRRELMLRLVDPMRRLERAPAGAPPPV